MDINGTELGNCTLVTANNNTFYEALGQQPTTGKWLDKRGRQRNIPARGGILEGSRFACRSCHWTGLLIEGCSWALAAMGYKQKIRELRLSQLEKAKRPLYGRARIRERQNEFARA
jgi:hypothetical protein